MTKREIERFRRLLLQKKAERMNKSLVFKEEPRSEKDTGGDEADACSAELELGMTIRHHERDRRFIHKIEIALGKLDRGEFGLCDECGDTIGEKRLEARPEASKCISCKEMEEHHEQRYASL